MNGYSEKMVKLWVAAGHGPESRFLALTSSDKSLTASNVRR